jgi:hypothetical protein
MDLPIEVARFGLEIDGLLGRVHAALKICAEEERSTRRFSDAVDELIFCIRKLLCDFECHPDQLSATTRSWHLRNIVETVEAHRITTAEIRGFAKKAAFDDCIQRVKALGSQIAKEEQGRTIAPYWCR